MTSTLIVGLGNPLMADDGAGIQVIELLRPESLPPEVKILDGGTAGVGLVTDMEGYERVILIDCASIGGQPGEWRRFTLEETNLLDHDSAPLSLHDAGLQDALRLAETLGTLPPQVIIYGIEPAVVAWDQPMSEEVTAALSGVVQAVLEELGAQRSE